MLAVFYFLFIVPNRRQQKNRQQMMQRLGPGAKVLTAGGMYAQIVEVHGDIIVAKIAAEVEIELDSRSIVRVVEPAPESTVIDVEPARESTVVDAETPEEPVASKEE